MVLADMLAELLERWVGCAKDVWLAGLQRRRHVR